MNCPVVDSIQYYSQYCISIILLNLHYILLLLWRFLFFCKKISKLSSNLVFLGVFPLRLNERIHKCVLLDIFERQVQ